MNFGSLSVTEIGEMISSRRASVQEIISSVYDQIKATNREINCFITLCEDTASSTAARLDEKLQDNEPVGRLAGIPIAIKDNISTRGIHTTCGSKMLENYIPPYDAHVVEMLLAEDAIIIGKTNMDEFGMGSSNEYSAFGAVKNPHNHEYVPGGSSGGSAATLAADLVPLALGTDTGGSVRQPASFCGVTGFRPTYGTVSRYGLVAFASSFDQIGPMARSVSDCRLLYSVISGYDRRDSTSAKAKYLREMGDKIAIIPDLLSDDLNQDVKGNFNNVIEKIKQAGREISGTEIPHIDNALPAYYLIADSEASSNLARFDAIRYGNPPDDTRDLHSYYTRARGRGFGDEVKRRIMLGTFALSSGYYEQYYDRARRMRNKIRMEFEKAFEKVDFIITPTCPTPAFKLGQNLKNPLSMYLADSLTIPPSLAGLPCISIPCGKSSSGLPIGLQVIGPAFSDYALLDLAEKLEMLIKQEANDA